MSYSKTQWQIIKAYYEAGESLTAIINKPDVKVKARSQICKKAKADNWNNEKETKKKQLINKEVNARKEFAAVQIEKETLPPIEKNVINQIVEERTKDLPLIFKAGVLAVQTGEKILAENKTMPNVVGLSTAVKNVASVLEPRTNAMAVRVNETQAELNGRIENKQLVVEFVNA